MDLKQLRYFLAVAEERHFGRAAQRLHIVQPALSMQIRALEEDLGGPLFVRTSRKVELTQAGVLLLEEAKRTLAQIERAKTIVQRSLRGEIGKVRVGFAGNAVLAGEMMRELRAFRTRHPAVELELHEMAPHRQGDAILAGMLDVGYSSSLGVDMLERLSAETIGRWPFLLAMADNHSLAQHERVSLRQLEGEPFVLFTAPEGDPAVQFLKRRVGACIDIRYRVGSTLNALALAATGLGVVLVPEPLANMAIPGLVYRPLSERDAMADLLRLSRADEADGAVRAYLAVAREREAERPWRSPSLPAPVK